MRRLPGFVSANLHRSDDGTRLVNYAQWQSREDVDAMLRNQRRARTWSGPAALARFDPIVCQVAYVEHP